MTTVESLRIFKLSVELNPPYKIPPPIGDLTHATPVVVALALRNGTVGYGEADPLPGFTSETADGIVAALEGPLGQSVLGTDIFDYRATEGKLDGIAPDMPMASAALSIALHDAAGQALRRPVHELVGKKCHTALPIFQAVGSGSDADDVAALQAFADKGWVAAMLKVGKGSIAHDFGRLESARARFGDRMKIFIDANQSWSRAKANEFVELCRARSCWPAAIEQPLVRDDLEGLAHISRTAECPVSADESVVTVHDLEEVHRAGAASIISLKVTKNGGISRAKALAERASKLGLTVITNSMLECGITQAASLHVSCTLDNLASLGHAFNSTGRLIGDPTDFQRFVRDGSAVVPDGPGLGITVDVARLEACAESIVDVVIPVK